MEAFSLPLSNNAVVTGLRTPALPQPLKDTPLMVALHGGSYSAHYYHATPTVSALPYSNFLRVPFIAVNRPGYKDSTALPGSIPKESTFLQEEGKYLHHEIIPAIWKAFGEEYGVSSIVILAHSLSVPMTIVAAALNATVSLSSDRGQEQELVDQNAPVPGSGGKEDERYGKESENKTEEGKERTGSYALAGIILSGFGTTPKDTTMALIHPLIEPNATHVYLPPSLKDELMLLPASSGFTDQEVYEKTEELNTACSLAEFSDGLGLWPSYWKERYAKFVKCPVLYALTEDDCFWVSSTEAMAGFAGAFGSSLRVDQGVVVGGAHCLELCRAGRGWYARVFGWAVECAVAKGLGKF